MKPKKVIYPKVIRGGVAVPLGNNFYHMKGLKHKDGGIDVGENPNTGIEVEDDEVMHLTNNEVKVFSSVPFLNGQSPAQRVMGGDSPAKVFDAQEKFKKVNNINDDGSKKKFGGKTMKRVKYAGGGKKPANILKPVNNKINIGAYDDTAFNALQADAENNITTNFNVATGDPMPNDWFSRTGRNIGIAAQKVGESIDGYYDENPGALGDQLGIASNVIGSLISNNVNSKALNNLKFAPEPLQRKAAKLKTTININPQLDKMREGLAAYERDIDANTASSRVGLARKQRGRLASQLQTNELYGNKENLETELVNQDKVNQQRVNDANTTDYNRWSEGKANFDNAVIEKKAENKINLIDNINAGVQDFITRNEKRNATKDNMLAMSAASPNVNPRILKNLGVKGITDKMVNDWEKANGKKSKKG